MPEGLKEKKKERVEVNNTMADPGFFNKGFKISEGVQFDPTTVLILFWTGKSNGLMK